VYDLSDPALALGLVSFGVGVPLLLFSLYGGAMLVAFTLLMLLRRLTLREL